MDTRPHYDFDPKNYPQPTPKAPVPKLKPVRRTPVQRILDRVSGEQLLRASTGQAWVGLQLCDGHWYWPIRSGKFRDYLIGAHRDKFQCLPSNGALRDAIRLLEGC